MSFLARFSSSGGAPALFRSQSTRRRFLATKEFWFSAICVFSGIIWDIFLLSEPPAIVSWLVKSFGGGLNARAGSDGLVNAFTHFDNCVNTLPFFGILVSLGAVVFLLWEIWRQRRREAKTQAALRDFSQKMAESIRSIRHVELETLCRDCCTAAVKVFEPQYPRQGIGSAIRIRDKNKGFVTLARAGKISQARENSSEPVTFTGSLAKLLESDAAQRSSVILIPDVEAAYNLQLLERDENSKREEFKDEVKGMMIARIIAFDSSEEANIAGIFYITSDKSNGLNEESIDLMVTVSMMVSEVIREKLDITNMTDGQIELLKSLLDERRSSQSKSKTVRGEKSDGKKKGKKSRK